MVLGQERPWSRLRILGALALMAGMLAAPSAFAQSGLLGHSGMPTGPIFGEDVPPTVGAALWCGKERSEPFCHGVTAYRALHLDDATAIEISKVNTAVNVEIEPVDDMAQWHVPEKWNRPVRGADGRLQDDCDGYVIEKWYRLVREHHLPASAFYPLYAEVPGYGGHLVLAVVTDKGTYVLNNLTDDIVSLRTFKFTYLKRPEPGRRLDETWQRFVAFDNSPAQPAIVAGTDLALKSSGVSSAGGRQEDNARSLEQRNK